jgi:hypothetical protein
MGPPTSNAQATAPTSNATEKGSFHTISQWSQAGTVHSAPLSLPSPHKVGRGWPQVGRGEHTDCLCLIIVLADTAYSFINFAGQQQRAILGT